MSRHVDGLKRFVAYRCLVLLALLLVWAVLAGGYVTFLLEISHLHAGVFMFLLVFVGGALVGIGFYANVQANGFIKTLHGDEARAVYQYNKAIDDQARQSRNRPSL